MYLNYCSIWLAPHILYLKKWVQSNELDLRCIGCGRKYIWNALLLPFQFLVAKLNCLRRESNPAVLLARAMSLPGRFRCRPKRADFYKPTFEKMRRRNWSKKSLQSFGSERTIWGLARKIGSHFSQLLIQALHLRTFDRQWHPSWGKCCSNSKKKPSELFQTLNSIIGL